MSGRDKFRYVDVGGCLLGDQAKGVALVIYEGQLRIVEPQILGRNLKGHMVLSAWQVGGYSESGVRLPWRDYRVVKLSKVTIQNETFNGPRPGYVKGGGKKFSRVFC